MKTIGYFLAAFASLFFFVGSVSAQYGNRGYDDRCNNYSQQSFYYYPQSNVYYSVNTNQYIFNDRNSWVVSDRLPHHFHIRREPYFVVRHNGFNVWNDNRYHLMKYRDHNYGRPDVVYDRNDRYDDRRPDNNRPW